MLTTLLAVLGRLIDLYSLLIVVYVLLSWFPTNQGILRDINEVLGRVCDPYLNIFKRIIPPIGMIDISPIFALLVLQLVARFL